MANIGIYGGTFNPPHLGHVLAAKAAKEALGLNKVLLVPDAEPPPTPVQRVEMARLATQDEPWLEVSEMELGRPGKSYTSDTLRALAEQYPGDTLYLLMGTDMFLSLHTWHEPDVICHLAVIVGMHREEDKDGTMEQQKSLLEERFGAKAVVLHNVPLEISSTHLRRMLILGGADHYMNPGVLSYIRENGLYGTGRDYKNLPVEELRDVAVSLLKPKRGTLISAPVSTVAGLVTLVAVSPLKPGSVLVISRVTKLGGSTENTLPL